MSIPPLQDNNNQNVLPILQTQENDLLPKIQSDTSKLVAQPSTIFQKFIDTGDHLFKDAAGAALTGLKNVAAMPFHAVQDLMSNHVQYTGDNYDNYLKQVDKIQNTIADNETAGVKGDPYIFAQPSGVAAYGRAMGKYQVTEAELHTYAPRFLGQAITPAQFLASPHLQDMYMNHKISYLLNEGYTPEQVFDAHRGGMSKPRTEITHPGYTAAAGSLFNQ